MKMIQTTSKKDFRMLMIELRSKGFLFYNIESNRLEPLNRHYSDWQSHCESTVIGLNEKLKRIELFNRKEIHGMNVYVYYKGIINPEMHQQQTKTIKAVVSGLKQTKNQELKVKEIVSQLFNDELY